MDANIVQQDDTNWLLSLLEDVLVQDVKAALNQTILPRAQKVQEDIKVDISSSQEMEQICSSVLKLLTRHEFIMENDAR